ncbi:hypothetical protein SNE40_001433 [Patella caerulea]|uniref:Major facilitator superfamily (MFS) profile domain-containing protein n=1 Tax=Patella caerulea TaxID=87958 RepID=A0AAN8Q2Y4_PATCE
MKNTDTDIVMVENLKCENGRIDSYNNTRCEICCIASCEIRNSKLLKDGHDNPESENQSDQEGVICYGDRTDPSQQEICSYSEESISSHRKIHNLLINYKKDTFQKTVRNKRFKASTNTTSDQHDNLAYVADTTVDSRESTVRNEGKDAHGLIRTETVVGVGNDFLRNACHDVVIDTDESNDIEPWAWVILVAAFMNILLNGSLPYSVGVIHIAVVDRYPDEDIITISWLGSLFSSMFMLSAFIGSIVINVFNVRTCVMLSGLISLVGFVISSMVTDFRLLFLTFGLIAGCGQAMAYTGSMVVVGFYFKHKTGMAAGIITCGSSISLFVFPVVTQFLIDKYTLQGTFLILGAIGFHAAVCGALMRPTKYENGPTRYCRHYKRPAIKSNVGQEEGKEAALNTKTMANLSLLRCPPFVILLISSLTAGAALSTIYLFLPEYINTSNSSSQDTIMLLFIGIGSTFSRLFLGLLTVAADAAVLYGTTFGILGVITLFLNQMTSLLSQIIYAALFGLYTGGCFTLQHVIMVDIAGLNKLSTAYGINALAVGSGYLAGPPVIRFLVDDQYYIFVCSAGLFIVSCFMGLAIRLVGYSKQDVTDEAQCTTQP